MSFVSYIFNGIKCSTDRNRHNAQIRFISLARPIVHTKSNGTGSNYRNIWTKIEVFDASVYTGKYVCLPLHFNVNEVIASSTTTNTDYGLCQFDLDFGYTNENTM